MTTTALGSEVSGHAISRRGAMDVSLLPAARASCPDFVALALLEVQRVPELVPTSAILSPSAPTALTPCMTKSAIFNALILSILLIFWREGGREIRTCLPTAAWFGPLCENSILAQPIEAAMEIPRTIPSPQL